MQIGRTIVAGFGWPALGYGDMTSDNAFIRDLVDSMPTPQARLLLTSCLAKYAGQTIYIPTEPKQERRVRAAANMLGNGMSNADIAAAIVQRFNVTQRTAQRDVEKARNLSAANDACRS